MMRILSLLFRLYLPVVPVKNSPVWHGVEKRPVGLVAAPVVVGVEELPGHRHRHGLGGLESCRGGSVIVGRLGDGVARVVEVVQAGPPHPDAAAVDDHGSHGRHQATGAGETLWPRLSTTVCAT